VGLRSPAVLPLPSSKLPSPPPLNFRPQTFLHSLLSEPIVSKVGISKVDGIKSKERSRPASRAAERKRDISRENEARSTTQKLDVKEQSVSPKKIKRKS